MNRDTMNNIVAKEFSDALARCNEQGIDPGTVRTGLLTIAIANFVNGIGLESTIASRSASRSSNPSMSTATADLRKASPPRQRRA